MTSDSQEARATVCVLTRVQSSSSIAYQLEPPHLRLLASVLAPDEEHCGADQQAPGLNHARDAWPVGAAVGSEPVLDHDPR